MSEFYPVAKIEENPWNPNKMSAEAYGALLKDMKQGGPKSIDRILTASKRVLYGDPSIPPDIRIVIDGCHRLRGARELGWRVIREEFDPGITDLSSARLISYAKNYERGSMDPYKQAEYFKWFISSGWTQEDIAKEHRIDRTTVTRVLSLLKIVPDVKAKLADVPRLTTSHLELIATLPPAYQHKLVKENLEVRKFWKKEAPTVSAVEDAVDRMKRERADDERLAKVLQDAKFRKCPQCGASADSMSYRGAPYVNCKNYHNWNVNTGKTEQEEARSRGQGQGGTSEQSIPQSIKSERAMRDFRTAFNAAISKLLPTITHITDIDINSSGNINDIHITGQAGGKIRQVVTAMLPSIGKIEHIQVEGRTKARKKISLSVTLYTWSLDFKLERQGGKDYNLKISEAKIKDHPELRTRVGLTGYGNRIVSKEGLAKLELQVRDLFQEYGGR